MKLNTRPENRKEMVKAISELTATEATYLFTPTYAFQIGAITVNRDGTIDCEDETMIETLKPMLIERGWLEAEAETEAPVEAPADSKEIPEDTEPIRVAQMDIAMPVENWTVAQMTNLLRMLYCKQPLINRMLDYNMLYIEESFVKAISENQPETTADFEARIKAAIEADCICGFSIAEGKATLSTPAAGDEPERWKAYVHLWSAILKSAETAARINLKRVDDSENEKYHANSWLMRMDFGGPDFKETRRILMGHLNGFAAFKSAADMQAHKEKYAQRRRDQREVNQNVQPEA
jgi:hypothetical protein